MNCTALAETMMEVGAAWIAGVSICRPPILRLLQIGTEPANLLLRCVELVFRQP